MEKSTNHVKQISLTMPVHKRKFIAEPNCVFLDIKTVCYGLKKKQERL